MAAAVNAENTFERVAEEFIAKRKREGAADATIAKTRWHLDRLDKLHSRPIGDIEAHELLSVLRKLEARGNLDV